MQVSAPKRASLSTWAVHHFIGQANWDKPAERTDPDSPTGNLLQVPARAAELGINTLEVCHFHLARSRPHELAEAAQAHGVHLYQLLIDDGDLADPIHGQRDQDWIAEWITFAAEAGFARVRVIAGKTDGEGAMDRVTESLRALCQFAHEKGVRVVFENWFPLMSTPEAVLHVARELGDQAGLCFDFGNWSGPNKYDDLDRIVHLAESCHAKCAFQDGQPDKEDFVKCLQLTAEVGFNGPYTLVHGEAGDEWASLRTQLDLLKPFLG